MWVLLGPGIEPVSPALADGFFITEPPGKPCTQYFLHVYLFIFSWRIIALKCCIVVLLFSPTLCDPMNCSTPGFPVLHHLLEFTQTHLHWVSDVIYPSHPLSSPFPPAFNISQHRCLFQWVSSLHQGPKYWSFSFSPFSDFSGLLSLRIDWFDLFPIQGFLKSLLQHDNSQATILWRSAFFMVLNKYYPSISTAWPELDPRLPFPSPAPSSLHSMNPRRRAQGLIVPPGCSAACRLGRKRLMQPPVVQQEACWERRSPPEFVAAAAAAWGVTPSNTECVNVPLKLHWLQMEASLGVRLTSQRL